MGHFILCSFVLISASCQTSTAQDMTRYAATSAADAAFVLDALQTHMPTKQGNVPRLQPREQEDSGPRPKTKLDPAQLQREAQELLELSKSLQSDVESVNRGMLPRDAVEKLKRIQKLAKHLRAEIAP